MNIDKLECEGGKTMTIKELSKYHYIKLEINQLRDRITELDKTIIGSSKMSLMPRKTGDVSNPTEQLAEKRVKLVSILNKKYEKLYSEEIKIEKFLETIDDVKVRIIIRARFIDGKNWNTIGKELNFERTTPYYHLKKYLKEKEGKDVKVNSIN